MKRFYISVFVILSVFSKANGASIFADIPSDGKSDFGTYLLPNERTIHLTSLVNAEKKGALIAVGTFRVLAQASQGKFDEVVMLDYDRKIVKFNQKQIEALKASDNVSEFLAILCREPALAPTIDRILNG